MLARSLSLDTPPYFSVSKLPNPNEVDFREVLKLVEKEFETREYLAVWVEPVLQKTMEKVPYEFLRGLRELATKYSVALVYNETASQFYRFSSKNFMASCFAEISPDAGMIYFGGQSGIAYTSSKYFLEQPLMMISTWDGDEFHFLTYYHAFKNIQANLEDYRVTAKAFHEKLVDKLSRYEIDAIKLDNGFGYFRGSIPSSLSKMFIQHNGTYIVCPSFDAMKEYLES
jgi:glutamate-1-semialdehyde aminotransferase